MSKIIGMINKHKSRIKSYKIILAKNVSYLNTSYRLKFVLLDKTSFGEIVKIRNFVIPIIIWLQLFYYGIDYHVGILQSYI